MVSPEHLMVADSTGDSRIVEFVDGSIRITPANRPWQVCTNDIIWGKSEQECDDRCPRYRAGSELAEKGSAEGQIDDAKSGVFKMSVENWTMWTSLYDLSNRELRFYYKARLADEHIETFDAP
jgi:hypothetical protein